MGALKLFYYFHLFYQAHSNLNTFDEPRFFVIPTESTDGIDNLINFLQGLPVHEPVEFLEVGFDGCVVEAAGFVIGIEQCLQDALRVVGIAWLTGWPEGCGG